MNELAKAKEEIQTKEWFKNSEKSVQSQLMELDEGCTGFLMDLAARGDVIANVKVLAMAELLIPKARPIFGIFPVFKVQPLGNQGAVYHYQYFSWKQGPMSGVKGVLFVETDSTITHVILNKGEKFATATTEYDCIGGFTKVDEQSVLGVVKNFERELKEELGLETLEIKEVFDLGRLKADPGMTNNHPCIYAGVIDGKQAQEIKEGRTENPDIYELEMGTVIVPVEKLESFVMENDDSFFHICLNRFQVKTGISLY